MYALSTLMFVTVLILLILINLSPADKRKKMYLYGLDVQENRTFLLPEADSGSNGSSDRDWWVYLRTKRRNLKEWTGDRIQLGRIY